MKKLLFTILFLLSITILFSQETFISDKLEKIWETSDVLKICESVCYDAEMDVLFVSCINGNPTTKNGSGYIAQVSLEGEVLNEKWVSGLDAPKGMGIFNGKLYVTDIDNLVEIDISTAKIEKRFPVEGAKFLNDVTIDPKGIVYFSDMSTNLIHKLTEDNIEVFLDDPEISKPNGVLYENGDIVIGTKNGIFAIRISDGKMWHIIKNTGGIDGLKSDGNGSYIISDWKGKIQTVSTEDKPIVLLNTTEAGINAADIEYIKKLNLLLVPTFGANRVTAYKLNGE
jgi:outer membrane protein assembly factor BamB